MATGRANDLQAFKGFIDEHLSNGGINLTLDEALSLWEFENAAESELEETHRAIIRGLDDLQMGRVKSIEDSDQQFRQKHGLAPRG